MALHVTNQPVSGRDDDMPIDRESSKLPDQLLQKPPWYDKYTYFEDACFCILRLAFWKNTRYHREEVDSIQNIWMFQIPESLKWKRVK